jgi:hypothetical protein
MIKCYVFFAVRTKYLNIIKTNFCFKDFRAAITEFFVDNSVQTSKLTSLNNSQKYKFHGLNFNSSFDLNQMKC